MSHIRRRGLRRLLTNNPFRYVHCDVRRLHLAVKRPNAAWRSPAGDLVGDREPGTRVEEGLSRSERSARAGGQALARGLPVRTQQAPRGGATGAEDDQQDAQQSSGKRPVPRQQRHREGRRRSSEEDVAMIRFRVDREVGRTIQYRGSNRRRDRPLADRRRNRRASTCRKRGNDGRARESAPSRPEPARASRGRKEGPLASASGRRSARTGRDGRPAGARPDPRRR